MFFRSSMDEAITHPTEKSSLYGESLQASSAKNKVQPWSDALVVDPNHQPNRSQSNYFSQNGESKKYCNGWTNHTRWTRLINSTQIFQIVLTTVENFYFRQAVYCRVSELPRKTGVFRIGFKVKWPPVVKSGFLAAPRKNKVIGTGSGSYDVSNITSTLRNAYENAPTTDASMTARVNEPGQEQKQFQNETKFYSMHYHPAYHVKNSEWSQGHYTFPSHPN